MKQTQFIANVTSDQTLLITDQNTLLAANICGNLQLQGGEVSLTYGQIEGEEYTTGVSVKSGGILTLRDMEVRKDPGATDWADDILCLEVGSRLIMDGVNAVIDGDFFNFGRYYYVSGFARHGEIEIRNSNFSGNLLCESVEGVIENTSCNALSLGKCYVFVDQVTAASARLWSDADFFNITNLQLTSKNALSINWSSRNTASLSELFRDGSGNKITTADSFITYTGSLYTEYTLIAIQNVAYSVIKADLESGATLYSDGQDILWQGDLNGGTLSARNCLFNIDSGKIIGGSAIIAQKVRITGQSTQKTGENCSFKFSDVIYDVKVAWGNNAIVEVSNSVFTRDFTCNGSGNISNSEFSSLTLSHEALTLTGGSCKSLIIEATARINLIKHMKLTSESALILQDTQDQDLRLFFEEDAGNILTNSNAYVALRNRFSGQNALSRYSATSEYRLENLVISRESLISGSGVTLVGVLKSIQGTLQLSNSDLFVSAGGFAVAQEGVMHLSQSRVDVSNGGGSVGFGGRLAWNSVSSYGISVIQIQAGASAEMIRSTLNSPIYVEGSLFIGESSIQNKLIAATHGILNLACVSLLEGAQINVGTGARAYMSGVNGVGHLAFSKGSFAHISNCDLSQIDFDLDGIDRIDLSNNYWGTTDRNEILAKLGKNADKVILSSIMTSAPTEEFAITGNSGMQTGISSGSRMLEVYFSKLLDTNSISLDDIQLYAGEQQVAISCFASGATLTIAWDTLPKAGSYQLELGDKLCSQEKNTLAVQNRKINLSYSGLIVDKYLVTELNNDDAAHEGTLGWAICQATSGDHIILDKALQGRTISLQGAEVTAGVFWDIQSLTVSGYLATVKGSLTVVGGDMQLCNGTTLIDYSGVVVLEDVTLKSDNQKLIVTAGGRLDCRSVRSQVGGDYLTIREGAQITIRDSQFSGGIFSAGTTDIVNSTFGERVYIIRGSISGSSCGSLILSDEYVHLKGVTVGMVSGTGHVDLTGIESLTITGETAIRIEDPDSIDFSPLTDNVTFSHDKAKIELAGKISGNNILGNIPANCVYHINQAELTAGAVFDTNGQNLTGTFGSILGTLIVRGGSFALSDTYYSYVRNGGKLIAEDTTFSGYSLNLGYFDEAAVSAYFTRVQFQETRVDINSKALTNLIDCTVNGNLRYDNTGLDIEIIDTDVSGDMSLSSFYGKSRGRNFLAKNSSFGNLDLSNLNYRLEEVSAQQLTVYSDTNLDQISGLTLTTQEALITYTAGDKLRDFLNSDRVHFSAENAYICIYSDDMMMSTEDRGEIVVYRTDKIKQYQVRLYLYTGETFRNEGADISGSLGASGGDIVLRGGSYTMTSSASVTAGIFSGQDMVFNYAVSSYYKEFTFYSGSVLKFDNVMCNGNTLFVFHDGAQIDLKSSRFAGNFSCAVSGTIANCSFDVLDVGRLKMTIENSEAKTLRFDGGADFGNLRSLRLTGSEALIANNIAGDDLRLLFATDSPLILEADDVYITYCGTLTGTNTLHHLEGISSYKLTNLSVARNASLDTNEENISGSFGDIFGSVLIRGGCATIVGWNGQAIENTTYYSPLYVRAGGRLILQDTTLDFAGYESQWHRAHPMLVFSGGDLQVRNSRIKPINGFEHWREHDLFILHSGATAEIISSRISGSITSSADFVSSKNIFDALLTVSGGSFTDTGSTFQNKVSISGAVKVSFTDSIIANGNGISIEAGGELTLENVNFVNQANLTIASGATANINRCSGYTLAAAAGAILNLSSYTIASGETLNVLNKCSAKDILIESTGEMRIQSGGKGDELNLASGAYLYAESGSYISRVNIASGAYVEIANDATATEITLRSGASVAGIVNADDSPLVIGELSGDTMTGELKNAVISGTLKLGDGAEISGISGNFALEFTDPNGHYVISGNDFSKVNITFAGTGTIDLSGNYWGTTDVNEIYAKLGVDASAVRIDDVLACNPSAGVFSVESTDLVKNYLSAGQHSITFTFSSMLDASTVSAAAVSFLSATGKSVNITGVSVEKNTLTMTFEPLTVEGAYSIRFANSITDADGNHLASTRYTDLGNGIGEQIRVTARIAGPSVVKVAPAGDIAGVISAFQVYFAKTVNPDTLLDNVKLIAPDGTEISPTGYRMLTDTIAEFAVAVQTANGLYSVKIGTGITDYAGNALDQNGNGTGGEAEDAFASTFNLTEIDLTVKDVHVSNALTVGEKAAVSWNISNESGCALSGSWTDGVYLSTDAKWDISDKLLATYTHENGLLAGQTLSGNANIALSGVAEGSYYLLVRSDIYHDEESGVTAAEAAQNLTATPITVSVPSLTLDTAAKDMVTTSGDFSVYKFTQNAGESVRVTLDSLTDAANMELYVGYGYAPTREKYDTKLQRITDGTLTLSGGIATRNVYVMVYAKGVSKSFDYMLTAEKSPLAIDKVTQSSQDNTSAITLTITGTNFSKSTTVTLIDTAGNEFTPESMIYPGSSKLLVTIGADTLADGNYTVKLTDGATATSENAVNITGPGEGKFEYSFYAPGMVPRHGIATLHLTCSNTGTAAIDAPLVFFTPTQSHADGSETMGAILTLDSSKVNQGFWVSSIPAGFSDSLSFFVSGENAGTIQPGESVKIPITYTGWRTDDWDFGDSHINWNVTCLYAGDTTPLDWGKVFANTGYSTGFENAMADAFTIEFGGNWGGYYEIVVGNLKYLNTLGHSASASSTSELLAFEVMQKSGAMQPFGDLAESTDIVKNTGTLEMEFTRTYASDLIGRNAEGSFGYGWSCNWDVKLAIAADGDLTLMEGEASRLYQPTYTNTYQTVNGDGSVMKTNNTGYKLTEADGTVKQFDSNGRLLSVTSKTNERISCSYDANGKLNRLTNSVTGEYLVISRDPATGYITAIRDNAGTTVSYTYSEDGDLLTATNSASGSTESYEYFAAVEHALTKHTSADGTVGNYTYDTAGRLTSVTGGDKTFTLVYGDAGDVKLMSSDGAAVTLYYNTDGNIAKIVDDKSGVEYNYTFEKNGQFASGKDSAGNALTSTFRFSGFNLNVVYSGNLDFSGIEFNATYEPKPNTNYYVVDGITYYKTDGEGNILRQNDAAGEYYVAGYNAENKLVSYQYLKDGVTTTYTITAEGGYEIDVNDPSQYFVIDNIKYFKKDMEGNVLPQSDTTTDSYTMGYDAEGNRVYYSVTRNGETSSYSYNAAGQLVSETGGDGEITTYTYDADGNKATALYADGTTEHWSYDGDGKLVTFTDKNDVCTTYFYNDVNEQTSVSMDTEQTHSTGLCLTFSQNNKPANDVIIRARNKSTDEIFTSTTKNGYAFITGMSAGTYFVEFTQDGAVSHYDEVIVVENNVTSLQKQLGNSGKIRFSIDADYDFTNDYSSVKLMVGTSCIKSLFVTELGTYSFANIAPGDYTLSFSSDKGNDYTITKEVVVKSGETSSVDVTLSKKNTDGLLVTANTKEKTNKPVFVFCEFPENCTQLQYSLNDNDWCEYSGQVTVFSNSVVYFRGVTATGTLLRASYEVDNIDLTPPDLPIPSLSTTEPTWMPIAVYCEFSDDTVIKQYSLDQKHWYSFVASQYMTQNGIVYFRATDKAGNMSVSSIEINNYDNIPPEITKIWASIDNDTPTNQDVYVYANFSSDAVVKQYCIDGVTWNDYSGMIRIEQNNTTVLFSAIDAAGNDTSSAYTVTNIDKTPPPAPLFHINRFEGNNEASVSVTCDEADATIYYSYNNSAWQVYSAPIPVYVSQNLFFKASDKLGNTSDVSSCNISLSIPNSWIDWNDFGFGEEEDKYFSILSERKDLTNISSSCCNSCDYCNDLYFNYSSHVKAFDDAEKAMGDKLKYGNVLCQSLARYFDDYLSSSLNDVGSLLKLAISGISLVLDFGVALWDLGKSIINADLEGFILAVSGFCSKFTKKLGEFYEGAKAIGDAVASFIGNGLSAVAKAKEISIFRADATATLGQLQTAYTGLKNAGEAYLIGCDKCDCCEDKVLSPVASITVAGNKNSHSFEKGGDTFTFAVYGHGEIRGNANSISNYVWSLGSGTDSEIAISVTRKHEIGDAYSYTWKYGNSVIGKGASCHITLSVIDDLGNKSLSPAGITLSVTSDTSGSVDPNDKTVSEGVGEKGFVAAGSQLSYKVEFENDPEFATAPAQWVRVFDVLDVAKYDLDSFELKNFCIAGNYFEVGDGRDSYNGTVTLKVLDYTVTATISINLVTDEETGITQLVAEFMAIDPVSGFMLQDLQNGMLPINDAIGTGEGYINYTINARKGLAHGTELTNTAKIYFDFNEPIETPTTLNTVDTAKPVNVAVDATAEGTTVTLALSGTDAGSGIAGYHVRYSTDNVNFSDYSYSTQATVNFTGSVGSTYYFMAQAEDKVGNRSDWSAVQKIILSKADTTPPAITQIAASITAPTNQNVIVTASFADNVALQSKQYRIGSGAWTDYTSGVTMSANGTVHFKAVDTAGNEASAQYTVSNIDKVAPTITGVSPSTTAATNQNVTITAIFADNVALKSKQYKIDSSAWKNFTNNVIMSANGTVYFKAVDTAGNETTAQYLVGNIDKVAPTITGVKADITAVTNQNVTISAVFADDVALKSKQYKVDNGTWQAYASGVTVNSNGTVYFKAIDAAGNEANAQYVVPNIDKVAPTAPEARASVTLPTNGDVTVTATFAKDAVRNEYSFDGRSWKSYSGGVVFADNGVVTFRSFDAAGNESSVAYTVSNIDKLPPAVPQLTATPNGPTNQDVTITAVFAADATRNEYSFNGSTWQAYNQGITVGVNGTVHFRSFDAAGNMSNTNYTVSNIDKMAPDLPGISVNTTYRTNGVVTVTASFASDVAKKEYSLDGKNWQAYTGAVSVNANTTFSVRGFDVAGNESTAQYAIKNIVALDPKGPSQVALTAKISKYNATVKWKKPVTQDKAKITGYEVEVNGQTRVVKGTSLTLKNLPVSVGNTIQVRAIDSLGRYGALSTVNVFDIKDVTAPKQGKVTASISGYTGNLAWSGQDNVGIVRYVVNCAGQTQTVTGTSAQFDHLAVGKYKATVQGFDAAGNSSKVGSVSITVKDATPPEKVVGLTIPFADAKYNALLSWSAGKDNSGKVSGYEIKLDNGKIFKSSKNSLKVSKLSIGEHSYMVRAIDKDKNIGDWSEAVNFTVKDVTAPSTVSVKGKVLDNTLTLTWKTPKENVGVTGYLLKHGVNLEKSVTLTAKELSYTIDGIAKGNYQYQLIAFDAAGNQSKPKSGKATIKTELPMAMSLELPDAIPSLTFEAVAQPELPRVAPFDSALPEFDTLSWAQPVETACAVDSLTVDEKKISPLLAIGF